MKTVRPAGSFAVMGKMVPVVILLSIASCIVHVDGGTTHNLPWSTETNFAEWDKSNTIYLNDIIVFMYEARYTVTEVVFRGYINCNTTNAISNNVDGVTQMEMSQIGTRYFISSATGSCDIKHFFDVKSPDSLMSTSLVAQLTSGGVDGLTFPPAPAAGVDGSTIPPAPAPVPYMSSGGGGDGTTMVHILWMIIGGLMLAY